MSTTFQVTKTFFDAQGVKNQVIEDEKVLRVGFNLEATSIEVILIFDDNDRSVGLRSFGYVKFPADKKDRMYKVCSQLNDDYRWVKFYVDEDHNFITMADDAIVQVDGCGDELLELVMRMAKIGSDAYPKFMQAIYI